MAIKRLNSDEEISKEKIKQKDKKDFDMRLKKATTIEDLKELIEILNKQVFN